MTTMTQIWILMMIGSKEEMDETNCVKHLKKKKKKMKIASLSIGSIHSSVLW